MKICAIDLSSSIIGLFSSLLILIGSFIGVCAMSKWHEKQLNAKFTFYSKLKVYLKILKSMTVDENFKCYIINRFLPINLRKPIINVFTAMADNHIELISERAKQILNFLMKEDNQIPASKSWASKLDTLIEFLCDLELIGNKNFCKFLNDTEAEDYLKQHIDNISALMSDIEKAQKLKK